MKTSIDRILTTHVGSLPRPQNVVDYLFAEDQTKSFDRVGYDQTMREEVGQVAKKQSATGVDIISDGEMSKISYATYIRHRLTGFEIGDVPRATPQDLDEFPEFRDRLAHRGEHRNIIAQSAAAQSQSRILIRSKKISPI